MECTVYCSDIGEIQEAIQKKVIKRVGAVKAYRRPADSKGEMSQRFQQNSLSKLRTDEYNFGERTVYKYEWAQSYFCGALKAGNGFVRSVVSEK